MGGWRTTLFDSETDGDGAGIEHKFQKGQFLLDIRGKKITLRIMEHDNRDPQLLWDRYPWRCSELEWIRSRATYSELTLLQAGGRTRSFLEVLCNLK